MKLCASALLGLTAKYDLPGASAHLGLGRHAPCRRGVECYLRVFFFMSSKAFPSQYDGLGA